MNVYLNLGSNLGARESFLWNAIELLRPHLQVLQISPFYSSAPVGITEQPDFLNLCVQTEYAGTALDLLALCKHIERQLGRQQREKFGPREVDLDLIHIDGLTLKTDTLILPHPRCTERRFVLDPLADLAPNLIIPGTSFTTRELTRMHPLARSTEACRLHFPTIRFDALTPWWIRQALNHMGTFVLDQVFPVELAQTLIREARQSMRHSMLKKLACAKKTHRGSGYTPPGVEQVARYGPDFQREFWDVHSPIEHRNLFPEWNLDFADAAEASFLLLEQIAMHCFHQVDAAYGTHLVADTTRGDHMLRCSRYLAGGDPARVLFEEHRDSGLFTFFGGGVAPGVEGEYCDTWHPLHDLVQAGRLQVAVGNTLRLYLPHLKAFHHRVTAANMLSDERLSYTFFTEPRRDVILPNGQLAAERMDRFVQSIRKTPLPQP